MALVADNAGRPTTSSAVRTPTLAVADRPVKLNTADSTVPQPFSPQSKVPQPGLSSTVNEPNPVVACYPSNNMLPTIPQAPSFQVFLPQPFCTTLESFQSICPQ